MIRKQKKLIKQLIIGTALLLIVGSQADLKACELITNMQSINGTSFNYITFESGRQEILPDSRLETIESKSGLFVKIKECAVAYSLIEKQ